MNMTTPTLPPRWQELFGLEPHIEAAMDRDERREALNQLVDEVERLARQEFAHAAQHPDPRRSFMWDPLDHICNVLEISRVKLSRYTLEVTGLRAHEITDRIKAAALPEILRTHYEKQFAALVPILETMFPLLPALTPVPSPTRGEGGTPDDGDDAAFEHALAWTEKAFRESRTGQARIIFAIQLGYANPSRLFKACQFAHGTTIPALEEECARTLVQKFFEGRKAAEGSRKDAKAQRTEKGSREEETAVAQAVLPSPLLGEGPGVRGNAGPDASAERGAKVCDRDLEALKAELGLEGELSSEDREALEAMLSERAA
ncbi:MAG TPA: hypothetical protein VEJ63_11660 [Planctomycetota bacterium]|nr:hypothetical protein [Planctomycetota bacterium]